MTTVATLLRLDKNVQRKFFPTNCDEQPCFFFEEIKQESSLPNSLNRLRSILLASARF